MTKEEFISKVELKDKLSTYPLSISQLTKELDKKSIIKNRQIIFNFAEKFEELFFYRIESKSGDKIQIRIVPNGFQSYNWEDLNTNVVEVGKNSNAAGIIEFFYMSEEGLFYNQDQKLISDNEDDFLNYLLTVEYDYHPIIADITYSRLKDAGWYEGRKIDISKLVEECAADGVVLSPQQIEFIEEFGGIAGVGNDKMEFGISDKKEWKYYKKIEIYNPKDKCTTIKHGTNPVCVGYCDDGMMLLWITVDGLLVMDDGMQLGRTVMEGFNCLLGRV